MHELVTVGWYNVDVVPFLSTYGMLILAGTIPDASSFRFRPVVVCDAFPGGYQVAVADMNGDGRPDILGLGESPGGVDWFENPGSSQGNWKRHPITGNVTRRNIDLAVRDVDGDGRADVMVASEFDLGHSIRPGAVTWFHRTESDESGWVGVRVNSEPTAHRIRWADIDGDKRKELITVPILGKGAKAPAYQDAKVRLLCQWIPKDPAREAWPEQVIDESLTVLHGACVMDWDGDGRDELLTASNEGVHLFQSRGSSPDIKWRRMQLGAGHAGQSPNRGSSEIGVGRSKRGGQFLATIEPWHGNEVVVYMSPPRGSKDPALGRREVIDASLRAGHALCCVDLDGDGEDEIVAGYRGEGTSLCGYHRSSGAPRGWERFEIDAGGIAAQCVVAADVDGDGRLDLVSAGGSTHNVKLYLNATQQGER